MITLTLTIDEGMNDIPITRGILEVLKRQNIAANGNIQDEKGETVRLIVNNDMVDSLQVKVNDDNHLP